MESPCMASTPLSQRRTDLREARRGMGARPGLPHHLSLPSGAVRRKSPRRPVEPRSPPLAYGSVRPAADAACPTVHRRRALMALARWGQKRIAHARQVASARLNLALLALAGRLAAAVRGRQLAAHRARQAESMVLSGAFGHLRQRLAAAPPPRLAQRPRGGGVLARSRLAHAWPGWSYEARTRRRVTSLSCVAAWACAQRRKRGVLRALRDVDAARPARRMADGHHTRGKLRAALAVWRKRWPAQVVATARRATAARAQVSIARARVVHRWRNGHCERQRAARLRRLVLGRRAVGRILAWRQRAIAAQATALQGYRQVSRGALAAVRLHATRVRREMLLATRAAREGLRRALSAWTALVVSEARSRCVRLAGRTFTLRRSVDRIRRAAQRG